MEIERKWPMREAETLAIAEAAPAQLRLAITAWAVRQIATHVRKPAMYREMVHGRMGFPRADRSI